MSALQSHFAQIVARAACKGLSGLALMALGGFALLQAGDLAPGTLRRMGPGMFPQALAAIVFLFGLLIAGDGLVRGGVGIERLGVRGPIFVLGGAVAFALAVRPLGLIVAAPLVLLIVSGATAETRWTQSLVFAALLTAFSLALFRYALQQPIPVAPWLIGY